MSIQIMGSEPSQTEISTVLSHFNRGQSNQVEIMTRAMTVNYPHHGFGWQVLGVVLQMQGRVAEALIPMQKAAELMPRDADCHNNLGVTLHKLGQLSLAEASFFRALRLRPAYSEAYNNLGAVFIDLARFSEAEQCFRQALKLKPAYAEALMNLGRVCDSMDCPDKATLAYQAALSVDPDNVGLEAAICLAVHHYLEKNFLMLEKMLRASKAITAKTYSKKSLQTYWTYLSLLLTYHQQTKKNGNRDSSREKLHVVGESHSLSGHGEVVRYRECEIECAAEWIPGCKQWHLGNDKPNKYKHKFEAILKRFPRRSSVLLTIGEIDCRSDEGIITVWKKSPDKSLDDITKDTTSRYVAYVAKIAEQFEHRIIIGGVAATNHKLDMLTSEASGQFVSLIRMFNSILKEQALSAGMDFLDVYALTDRGDGIANGEWHIDGIHLFPSAMAEVFSKHCIYAR